MTSFAPPAAGTAIVGRRTRRGRDGLGERHWPRTRDDLPPADTERWVARRKAQVVAGVRAGLISLEEACRRYALSVEEFLAWERGLQREGLSGLRARAPRR